MSGEFSVMWADQNAPQYAVNAQNMHFTMPSVGCLKQNYLHSVDGQRRQLQLDAGTYFKLVAGGVHKVVCIQNDLVFDPQNYLDVGTTFDAGKDYSVYVVNGVGGADLKVSLNATYPNGASAQTSRRIGGFHTLCADVGPLSSHALYGFVAGDILPLSVWDLKKRPICEPGGMVFEPKLKFWVDIYLQSGTEGTTASLFGGTVTKNQSWDSHAEDLATVRKRMLYDQEFTSIAWGTVAGLSVQGAAFPVTTGGLVFTNGVRIVSNIGVEDCCGCYFQWINAGMDGPGSGWANAVPAGQGQQYLSISAMMVGGYRGGATYSGPRCRFARDSRATVRVDCSSRGASDNISAV